MIRIWFMHLFWKLIFIRNQNAVKKHFLATQYCPIMPMLTIGPNTIAETFQMRYCIRFLSKNIKNIKNQSQNFQKSALLSSRFKSVKVWPLVFQVPIDENFHTVSHLKSHTMAVTFHVGKGMEQYILGKSECSA